MVFEEKQTMLRWWWILILFPLILIIVIAIAVQENDAKKAEIISSIGILVAAEAFIVILFALMRLYSRIDDKGVHFGFSPFIKKRTHQWKDIEKVWVRKYSPLGEYGGWGIKTISPKKRGIAYNVWGNKGLQIHLKNGKKILIGTQKPDEMAAFLKQLKQKYQIEVIEKAELNNS